MASQAEGLKPVAWIRGDLRNAAGRNHLVRGQGLALKSLSSDLHRSDICIKYYPGPTKSFKSDGFFGDRLKFLASKFQLANSDGILHLSALSNQLRTIILIQFKKC